MPRQQTHGYSHAIHTAWLDDIRGGFAIKSMVQTHETTVTTVAEVAVSEGVLQLESVLLSKYHPFCNASGSVFHLTFGSTNLHWKRKCFLKTISILKEKFIWLSNFSIWSCILWLEPLFWGESWFTFEGPLWPTASLGLWMCWSYNLII